MRCPIRNHDHELVVIRNHTQEGTCAKARTLECPTQRYRWFHIEGKMEPGIQLAKPRWGWKK